ncbi:hypothetical protein CO666_10245 [Rhizobium chutanense]|uniref:Transport-associated OB type 2 domain-containing protein n=1 Tax=Rhizobium chutanense TaxID=2035448 RepID=A0A2A6JDD1_9HYPH|nr:TOBE domain-containing protein [Rhizobium chutanense]PDT04254.1 hypothetical protein CO666_10245 [Rhizobium chutanense]
MPRNRSSATSKRPATPSEWRPRPRLRPRAPPGGFRQCQLPELRLWFFPIAAPEHLTIGAEGLVEGEIMVVERLGGHTYVYVQIMPGQLVIVETDGADSHQLHQKVRLSFNAGDCHLFDEQGLALERMRHTSISTH